MDVLETTFFNNTLWQWLSAVGLAVACGLILSLIKLIIVRRLTTLAARTSSQVDDVLADVARRTSSLVITVIALYCGSLLLTLPDSVLRVEKVVFTIVIFLQVALWCSALVEGLITRVYRSRHGKDAGGTSALAVVSFFARLAVWSVVAFLTLDNLGVDVTTLVAGLGIGGIAVALAVQNTLGDLFCSVAILMDKPFEVGDFIVVDDLMGTVERIGIKTTRLKSLSGEQLVLSNSDLVGSRIRNYKHLQERRSTFSFGVTYDTPVEKLERIPMMIKEIILSQSDTRFDRVHFKELGDSALVFECVYYVLTPDYCKYMDIQQQINLAVVGRFQQDAIEFAYPTQTLYINK